MVQLFGELVFGLASELLADSALARWYRTQRDDIAATTTGAGASGALVLGATMGAVTSWLIPHRLIPGLPLTGLSLIVSPVVAILVMRLVGARKRARGRPVSVLTSPLGAGAFALGFAIVRVLWLFVVSAT